MNSRKTRAGGQSRQARVVVQSRTADLVRSMIDNAMSKSQEEIAIETGFTRSNVLTMIKQGRTKLPFDKIEPFAKACGMAPDRLLRTALTEYAPELAYLVGHVYKTPMYDGFELITDLFNETVTEVLVETRVEHQKAAKDEDAVTQSGRLTASLDVSPEKLEKLKAFIRSNMVNVTAGEQEVPKFVS